MRSVIHLLLTIALVHIGAAATAQVTTIPVRAGEHAEFTRVVIRIPQDNGWSVTAEGRTARLTIDGPELRFDLSQTFSKIPRTRLREVQAILDGLEFGLACDCELRANEDIPQFLVIDILGSAAPIIDAESLSGTRPRTRPDALGPDRVERSRELDRAGRDLARRLRGNPDPSKLQRSLVLHPALLTGPAPAAARFTADGNINAQSARDDITRQLGRALANSVSLGTLAPTENFISEQTGAVSTDDATSEIDGALDAHLAMPRDGLIRSEADLSATPEYCRLLEILDFQHAEQAADRPPRAPPLAAVFGEFDEINHGQIVKVIKHYLSIGFGAEARLGASLLDQDDPLRDLIIPISHAIDLDPHAREMAPEGIANCGPSGLLWAFLFHGAFQLSSDESLNFLVQASESLPEILRLHLGPTIVKRLIAQGYITTAQRIQASVDRVTQTDTLELKLASVAVAFADHTSNQDESLVASLSPELSDEALVFMLSRRDQRGEAADAGLLELAENRLLALRGVPIGSEIARLLTRAFARNAAFDEAFSLTHSRHSGLSSTVLRELTHWLFDALAQTSDDTIFIVTTFTQRPWLEPYLPEETRRAMASRLDRLGFADQAALLRGPTLSGDELLVGNHFGGDQLRHAPEGAIDSADETQDFSNETDVIRARSAQAQFQADRALSERAPNVPAGLQATEDNLATIVSADATLPGTAEQVASAVPAQEAELLSSTDWSQRNADVGMLLQARTALDESRDLRTRLQTILAQPMADENQNAAETEP